MSQYYLVFLLILGLLALIWLINIVNKNISQQVDQQITKIIPIKLIRDKIKIKIKWR